MPTAYIIPDDRFSYHSGMMYSTKDRDNDRHPTRNCADSTMMQGGGWFDHCSEVTLTNNFGYYWGGSPPASYALKSSYMMVRRDN